jgi:hypothetical protein
VLGQELTVERRSGDFHSLTHSCYSLFASDTIKYSGLFLVGFVFLSNFFGKIAEFLSSLLPKKHNSLEARLANTRVFACWPWGWMPCEKKPQGEDGADQAVAEMSPDDQALMYLIDQLSKLKPDVPNDDDAQHDRGIVSAITGKSILSMNMELLEKEESLLRAWLDVVQYQKERALKEMEQREVLEEEVTFEPVIEARLQERGDEDESHPEHGLQEESPIERPSSVSEEKMDDGGVADANSSADVDSLPISTAHETFKP